MIRYEKWGLDKQLNQIVIAGSHDAGITGGEANVKTQEFDIAGQAEKGVRFFDLRVTGVGMADQGWGLGKEAELRTFHADKSLMKNELKSKYVWDVRRKETFTQTKLRGGAFGLGLKGILEQAKSFVKNNDTEFLILKFDKCENWKLIAEACVNVLGEGDTLYQGTGNLNTTQLFMLQGQVIVLFTPGGLAEVFYDYPIGSGILGVKNLAGGDAYDPYYHGMQYFGKGGTSVAKPFQKIDQNAEKQANLMSKGAGGDSDVLGMMYWTTTGISESIKERNNTMWEAPNVTRLKDLWRAGLSEAITSRLTNIDPTSYVATPILKAFMPNIVMVDFADDFMCKTISDLNDVAAADLTRAAKQANDEVKQAQEQFATLQKKWRK